MAPRPIRPGAQRRDARQRRPDQGGAKGARERPAGGSGGARGNEWLYGRNAVRESLRAGRRRFSRLLVAAGSVRGEVMQEIVRLAGERETPVDEAARENLDELTGSANHQGACLLAREYPYEPLPDILSPPADGIFLALDSLQDPQNLGTLLRTAEAVGVRGVLIPEHRAVAVTPAVVNAAAGATEHLRIARVTNLARSLDDLKEAGVWVVGLEDAPGAVQLWETRLDGPVALVVGSEGEGVRRLVLQKCDALVRLPLLGKVESLNASVAGSVALYEILRRRS